MALPCASARRSRLLPAVFDDCSCVGRMLTSRVRAIIRKLNETAFALSFMETGGVGRSEPFHLVREPDHQAGLSPARQLFGDCSRVVPLDGNPALGSLTVFQFARVARPQDASKAPNLVSLLSSSARLYLDLYTQRVLRLFCRRHHVGFICDLAKLAPSGMLKRL